MSVNKVTLLGNIGNDPVIRTTKDSAKIASFSVATSEKWKDKGSNEMREKTEWHRVVVFADGLSGIIEKYAKKGTKVYIEGSLQTRKWSGTDGVEKYTTEVILQGFNCKFEIINGNKSPSKDNEEQGEDFVSDDDIPF